MPSMSESKLRFNPPPGWPTPPPGWQPPEGWQPDPTWPAAPEGWVFWVPDDSHPSTDLVASPQRTPLPVRPEPELHDEPALVQMMPTSTITAMPVRTNHVFHLIMSIITVGFWLPVWLFMTIFNSLRRKRVVSHTF